MAAPERGLQALSPRRQQTLAAMGFDLMAMRTALQAGPAPVALPSATRIPPRVRLVGLPDAADAPLLRALLAALGIDAAQVTTSSGSDDIVLAFGEPVAGAALQAPALAQLADARAKRALWVQVRALRRRLQDDGDFA